MPTYSIHTDVMSEVVLENTLDIKCIFKQAVILSLFCSGSLHFFLLLNYQIIATEKILKFCVEKSFLEHAQSDE